MRGRALSALATAALAWAAAAQETGPASLPTPYTAEQIRAVWQPGLRVETTTLEAGVATRRRLTVIAATPAAVTIREESLDAAGEPREPARDATAKWEELRDHALFPAASATRARAECRSGLGALPGWRYVVRLAAGDELAMCFADATPGPPVELERRRGAELISRTEHTSQERPSGAEEKR